MNLEIKIDRQTPAFTIGTVSRMLDISVHTLRMYEREGLIIPTKKDSNHRLYSQSDIDRLNCIRKAISEMKYSIPSIKTLYSMIPCWTIVNCSESEKKICPAYNGHTEPCWTYKHKGNICEELKCQVCEVYTNYSNCEQIKNGIKQFTEN